MALWRLSNTRFGALLDPHAPDYVIFHIRVSMIESHTLSRRGLMDIGCEMPTSRETEASESQLLWASSKSQRCVPGLMESWAPSASPRQSVLQAVRTRTIEVVIFLWKGTSGPDDFSLVEQTCLNHLDPSQFIFIKAAFFLYFYTNNLCSV